MTKAFLIFPTGVSGVALVLLRLSAAVAVLAVLRAQTRAAYPIEITAIVLMVLLGMGLFTRVAAGVSVLGVIAAWASAGSPTGSLPAVECLQALALLMLGPGGYSFDARLFGRRVINLERKADDTE